MVYYWYFISCFCAVYKNTQIILIGNTLISFLESLSYPFAIELIPGLFRIQALKPGQKNRKCLYKFSKFLSLF